MLPWKKSKMWSSLHPTPHPLAHGYTFKFYKSTWNTIGKPLCEVVSSFFHYGSIPKHVKATAIALIPKRPHAANLLNYRHISLCNIFNKIIAKILANSMKAVMPFIIHPSKSDFINDRVISYNILLAAELLGDFNPNSRDKYFCVKFDIYKAFDIVSMEYLLNRLLAKGFPPKFISWIK
ncbi:hypothetical protein KFK09_019250 [Dendrobium nobile]|uniref:Reverse transcriptase domain-containing protein n=1 Tax=Dendrobium nobile TaxID=94219 RepID=A0A8T3AZG4_DENNO|nr:hypothetical protein KFK09_019250 [Dendrobium nobile]